jgi:TPR repeat protein
MEKAMGVTSGAQGHHPRAMLEAACERYEAGDRKRSMELFERTAALGVVEAQVNLANMLDDGDGVPSDFEAARYWYRRAIKAGSPEAAYNLGLGYLRRNNRRWARYWLQLAESMGDEDAPELLRLIA